MRDRGTALKLALAFTCVVLVIELLGGLASHSLALLSDAGHVLTDVFALGLAWFAVAQANRPADQRRSYGYHRVSILAALVNSVVLIGIVIAIGYEALRRLAADRWMHWGNERSFYSHVEFPLNEGDIQDAVSAGNLGKVAERT